MKKEYFFTVFAIVTVLLISSNMSFGQTAASVYWSTKNPDNESPSTINGDVAGGNLEFGGDVLSVVFNQNGVASADWDSASLYTDDYYEFIISPTSGNNLQVDSLVFDANPWYNNTIQTMSAAIYYSLDSFATPGTQIGSNINLTNTETTFTFNSTPGDFPIKVSEDQMLSVRIYGWGAAHENVLFALSDITISGSTCPNPVAKCQDTTIYLDASGSVTIDSTFIDNGSSDVCGIATMTLDLSTFDCSNVGPNTVVMTVTDVNSNVSTCSSTVTVLDSISPVAICQDTTVYLDATGNVSIDSTYIDNGSSDTCIASITLDVSDFDCSKIGFNTVVMTVSDANSNISTCSSTVTVLDTVSPEALCKDIVIGLNEDAQASITPDQVDNGSNDACGILSLSLDYTNFTKADMGANPVVLTVTDNNGNVSTCSSIVTIADRLAPRVRCNAMDFVISSDGGYELTQADVDALAKGTSDNINAYEDLLITVSPLVLTCDHIGETTLRVYASDKAGNGSLCTVEIGVTAIKDEPIISAIADVNTNEDVPVSIGLSGIVSNIACGDQSIVVTASNNNTELISSLTVNYELNASTGTLDFDLVSNQSGTDSITVVVEDSNGAKTSESFILTVAPVNDAPFVANAIPDGMVNASHEIEVPISLILGVIFDDVDDDLLELDIVLSDTDTLPAWAEVEDNILSALPMITDTGSYSFAVTAIDPSGAMATDTFMLIVEGYPTAIDDIGAGLFEVNMYPNPTKGEVNLNINSTEIKDCEVVITSVNGSEVFRKEYRADGQIKIDLSEHVSGMYLVTLKYGDRSVIRKLILD